MPVDKSLPFSHDLMQEVAETYGTPIYVYDEAGIRNNARRLNKAFAWSRGYVNHFAVKATPTPGILRIMKEEGMGFDCSSRGELTMVEQEGLIGDVFYTSNNTPDDDYKFAHHINALINVDKVGYVKQVQRALGRLPTTMAIRYNPGNKKAGNGIIGKPAEQKFGDTDEHVIQAFAQMRTGGVERICLHSMVASNEKNPEYFADTARLIRELAEQIPGGVDFVNVGGGLGINYHPDENPVDVEAVAQAVQSELQSMDIPVVTEHGRFITGPHGYLLTRVTHGIQETYESFVTVDTSINNLARLATVTAAYHHIDVLGRENDATRPMTIVGSMCANTDRMFKARELPATIEPNDLMVIHDVGAHSRANSHNYNFLRRAGEVLIKADGTHTLIRRHETIDDLLATTKGL